MRFVTSLLWSSALFLSTVFLAPSVGAAEYPEEYSQRPQTLSASMIELKTDVAVDLSARRDIQPAFGFGFRWGVTNGFELGLDVAFAKVQSEFANTEVLSARGILWHSDAASLSLGGGLQLTSVGNATYYLGASANLGFYTRLGERAGLRVIAEVQSPLAYRDYFLDGYGFGLEPSFNLTSSLAAYLNVGARAAFRDVDTASGGVTLGLLYTIDRRLDLGASFGMPNLVSGRGLDADARVAAVSVRWRFDRR